MSLHQVLDPVPRPRPGTGLARALAHLVGLGLTFTLSLVGGGAAFHFARGPHVHICSPPAPPVSCIAGR